MSARRRNLPDEGPGELTHNPFAALRPDGAPPAPDLDQPEPPAEPPPPAGAPRVVVRREKKGRGGKTVTRVAGIGRGAEGLAALARDVKRALGCGATVEEGDLLLQGDQTERAASWLEQRLGGTVTRGN